MEEGPEDRRSRTEEILYYCVGTVPQNRPLTQEVLERSCDTLLCLRSIL